MGKKTKQLYLDEAPVTVIASNGDSFNVHPSAIGNNNLEINLPDVVVKGDKKKTKWNATPYGYRSAFDGNAPAEFAGTMINGMPMTVDRLFNMGIGAIDGKEHNYYPVQGTMSLGSLSRWAGTARDAWNGKLTAPWSEENRGLTGNPFLDMAFDVAAIPIAVKTGKYTKGVAHNVKNRNRHAYVNIDPVTYNDPFNRGMKVLKSILSGEDVDIDTINPLDRNSAAQYITNSYNAPFRNLDKLSKIARDEAWRKYLKLPTRDNIYIDNGDGTVSYNMNRIEELAGGKYNFKGYTFGGAYYDDVTGAGGGLTKSVNIEKPALWRNKYNSNDTIGKKIIEDIWDLQPFQRGDKQLGHIIQESLKTGINEVYQKLYPKLYSRYEGIGKLGYGDKKLATFLYNYSGGKTLDRARIYGIFNDTINKFNNKIKDIEVGRLLGGKPFKMHTEIPYTKKIKFTNNGIDLDSYFEYARGWENIVPLDYFTKTF